MERKKKSKRNGNLALNSTGMKKFPLCKGRGKDIKGTLKVTAKYGDGSEKKKIG